MTHDDLSALACRWLKRAHSANGPGCKIALTEVGGLWGGERADAWGYRWGFDGGSVLVEVKVSRSDFLADAKKPHRNGEKIGMGLYRYYLCPEGIIQPEELPEGWGLLWVNKRGHIKAIAGHVQFLKSWKERDRVAEWQNEHNRQLELDILAHTLSRVGDPQVLNERLRELQNRLNRSLRENERIRKREGERSRRTIERLQRQLGEVRT